MFKQGLLAAGLVLAAAPAFAQVQILPGPPMPPPPPGTHEVERTTTTITTVAPPPLEAETPPPSAPDLTWKPGHWAWNLDARNYEWVKGSYVERPANMVAFTPGHWEHRPDGWMWIDGHWR